MPLNCECEGPGDLRDTSLGYWLGNHGFADFAEGCEFDAFAYDVTFGKSFCGLAGLLAAHAIELVWRGLDLPALSLTFNEISQIVTSEQNRTSVIHHGQACRYPIANCAG